MFQCRSPRKHPNTRRTRVEQTGQALVEYILLIALIGLVVLVVVSITGDAIAQTFRNVSCGLNNENEDCSCAVNEVITKGPNFVCVSGTFAFSALTSCGDKTDLSLLVEPQEMGLSYDSANTIFATSLTDQNSLCSAIDNGGVSGYLISRHDDDETVNSFPVTLVGSTSADEGTEGEDTAESEDGTGGEEEDTGGEDDGTGGGEETAQTCPGYILASMNELSQNCSGLDRNSACYGRRNVLAEFLTQMPEDYFSAPADRTGLFNVRGLRTTALAPSADQWGIGVLNIQANLPNTLPGQHVVMLMIGDTQVDNDVSPGSALDPVDGLTVVTDRGTTIRSAPTLNANAITGVTSSTSLTVDGRSGDGNWLRTWINGTTGWIHREAVNASGSLSSLPTIGENTFTPMQVFRLQTRIASEPECTDVPNVILLQNPENTNATLRVNENTISIGSTVVMRTDEATSQLEVIVLDGTARLNDVALSTCQRAVVSGGRWTDVRTLTAAEQAEMQVLEGIPSSLLHYPVNVCSGSPSPTEAPALAMWAGSATCSRTIQWTGNNTVVNGSVHSNRDIDINNSSHAIFGETTYVTSRSGGVFYDYPYPIGASGNTPQQTGSQSDPVSIPVSRFAPGGDIALAAQAQGRYFSTSGKIDKSQLMAWGVYDDSTGVLLDGIYYTSYSGSNAIDLGDSNIHGQDGLPARVTFVAANGGIRVGGANPLLEPYVGPTGDVAQNVPGILFYSNENAGSPRCNSASIHFSGSDQAWRGIAYAPHGLIQISGSNASFRGALVAYTIQISGSNHLIQSDASLFP